MGCRYCARPLERGSAAHRECDAEWGRRYDESLCTRCCAPIPDRDEYTCQGCRDSGAPYTGYSGGA